MLESTKKEFISTVNWCSRVLRNLGIGDVFIDADIVLKFRIEKNGVVTHQFDNLRSLESFVEHTMDRKRTRKKTVNKPYHCFRQSCSYI